MQWFRMYHEFATDPKVQMLSEVDQRRYIMLLCLKCCNGDVTLQDEEVAFQLRISNDEWLRTKGILVARWLLDDTNAPSAWDKRQYLSDTSAERVARHRAKVKQPCNVTVTAPDTDTDTETEAEGETETEEPKEVLTKTTKAKSSEQSGTSITKYLGECTSCPAEWANWCASDLGWPQDRADGTFAQFVDYWRGIPGAKGRKSDWPATWRNWCRRDNERTPRGTSQAGRTMRNDTASVLGAIVAARYGKTPSGESIGGGSDGIPDTEARDTGSNPF